MNEKLLSVPDSWTSVEDSLPIEGDVVAILVSSWGDIPYTGYLDGGEWHDADGEIIGGEHDKVTHWLPLPKPPKQALEKIGE